jgi:putative ABC transport system permease protein
VQGDVGVVGLAASLVLVLLAIGLSIVQRLDLERGIATAAVRAGVQLLLVGLALRYVLDPGQPVILALLWVVAMVVVAAETVVRRAPEIPGARRLAFASFAAAETVTLGVLFLLQVFPFSARTLVPLSGMILGNSMTATIVVGRRLVDEATARRDEIEARLALGQPGPTAVAGIVRGALRTALSPVIESTKAVGIIALPGAMTGLILAGVSPRDAVMVQIVVMYFLLAATATTTAIVAIGIRRRLITPDHRLVRLPQRAQGSR